MWQLFCARFFYYTYLFVGNWKGKLMNLVIDLSSRMIFLSMSKAKISHILKYNAIHVLEIYMVPVFNKLSVCKCSPVQDIVQQSPLS